jgi:hypothetical protein
MYITVDSENEDGSANCSVDLSHDEANQLISHAVTDLLKKGIAKHKEFEVDEEDEDEEHAIVIKHLKQSLVATYVMKFQHDEDIVHNLKVRRGCKALLRHFMIPELATKYIEQIESIHEGGDYE